MTKPTKKITDNGDWQPPSHYEAAVQELETLVTQLETNQLPLQDSLEAYRRGLFLLGYCKNELTLVEQQVKIYEDGTLKVNLMASDDKV